jgi:AP2 domain/HNH endonuclease
VTAKDRDIPIEYLDDCFALDAENGVLIWKRRPREHFASLRACSTWNTRFAGGFAGTPHSDGHLSVAVTIDGRRRILKVHRVVWALGNGRWPEHEVGHREGFEAGNGIGNLREATHAENQQNSKTHRNNTSAYPGVSRQRQGKWQAEITADGRKVYLGRFDTPEEAFMAYCEAKAKYHPSAPEPHDMTKWHASLAAKAAARRGLKNA